MRLNAGVSSIEKETLDEYFALYEREVTAKIRKQNLERGRVVDDDDVQKLRQRLGRRFWKDAFERFQSKTYVAVLRRKIRNIREVQLRSELSDMGMRRDGTIRSHETYYTAHPIMADNEDLPDNHKNKDRVDVVKHRHLCHYVPFLTYGSFNDKAASRLQVLNQHLLERFGVNKDKGLKTEQKEGWSLAHTVISGGTFAGREEGILGSIHWNQNLKGNCALQKETLEAVAEVLISAYGNKPWYKNLMKFFDLKENQYMRKWLIPGTPCTSIWWNLDESPFNKNHDGTALGAAFLFCPETYDDDAASVFVTNPKCDFARGIHLERNDVIAGRWSRAKHYSAPGANTVRRCSFVVYFDARLANLAAYKDHVKHSFF